MGWFFETLNVEMITTMIVAYIPNVIAAILVFLVFLVLYRLLNRPARAVLTRAGFHKTLIVLLVGGVLKFTFVVFGLVMAVSQLGIDVGAALAGIGVAGIALGFAAQDSLANTIAGFMIFWDKPFLVGDYVTVADQYGEVTEITLRSTRIRTNQHTYVVIPNKNIIDEVLVNHSKHGATRVDVPVGIAYKENVPEARRVILDAISDLEGVSRDRKPGVVVESLGDSSVNLSVRVWIDDAAAEHPVFFRTIEATKIALDAAGIQIPYPHLQLFLDDIEDEFAGKAASIQKLARAGGA